MSSAVRRRYAWRQIPVLRLRRAQALVEVDRRVGVGAPLHVDPEVRAGIRGVLGEPDEVREADLGVLVEPELRRLDRDLAIDARRPVIRSMQLDVVGDDLVGLGQALEVLAEPRVHRRDPGRLRAAPRR